MTTTIHLDLAQALKDLAKIRAEQEAANQSFTEMDRGPTVHSIQDQLTDQLKEALDKTPELKNASQAEKDAAFAAIYCSSAFFTISNSFALEEHLKNALNPNYGITKMDIYLSFNLKTGTAQSVIIDNGKGFNPDKAPWTSLKQKSILTYSEVLEQKKSSNMLISPNYGQKGSLGGAMKGLATLNEAAQFGEGKLQTTNVNYLAKASPLLDKTTEEAIIKEHENHGAILITTAPLYQGKLKEALEEKGANATFAFSDKTRNDLAGGKLRFMNHIIAFNNRSQLTASNDEEDLTAAPKTQEISSAAKTLAKLTLNANTDTDAKKTLTPKKPLMAKLNLDEDDSSSKPIEAPTNPISPKENENKNLDNADTKKGIKRPTLSLFTTDDDDKTDTNTKTKNQTTDKSPKNR